MTESTKQLFDAPWTIKYQVHEGWGTGFEIDTTNGMGVAVSPREEDANRLASLPELYDALVEATENYCGICHNLSGQDEPKIEDLIKNGCPKKRALCKAVKWLDLLQKVRYEE